MNDCYREMFNCLELRYARLKQALSSEQSFEGRMSVRLAAGEVNSVLKELRRISMKPNAVFSREFARSANSSAGTHS